MKMKRKMQWSTKMDRRMRWEVSYYSCDVVRKHDADFFVIVCTDDDEVDLAHATTKSLLRCRRDDLIRLCEERSIIGEGTKKDLVHALLEWVSPLYHPPDPFGGR